MQPGLTLVAAQVRGHCRVEKAVVGSDDGLLGSRKGSHSSRRVTADEEHQRPRRGMCGRPWRPTGGALEGVRVRGCPSVFGLSRPCPGGDLTDRMQLVVGLGMRVLLGHAGAELEVLAHGRAESFVVR